MSTELPAAGSRISYSIALAALAVMAGLVGANFHFVGDTIAGAFLGCTIGWITVVFFGRMSSTPLIVRKHDSE